MQFKFTYHFREHNNYRKFPKKVWARSDFFSKTRAHNKPDINVKTKKSSQHRY